MMHLCSRTLNIYAVMMEADRDCGARRGTSLAASGYVSDVQPTRQTFTYANISPCGVHLRACEDGRVHHRVRDGRENKYTEGRHTPKSIKARFYVRKSDPYFYA